MKKWKPLPLPKKDCTYQGTCDDGRIICDAAGDDVSPEYCYYCRYASKTYGLKPLEFSDEFFQFLMKYFERIDEKKEVNCE